MASSLISSIPLARVPTSAAGQPKAATGRMGVIPAPALAVLRLSQAPQQVAKAARSNKLVMRAIPVSGPSGDSCGGESGGSDGQVTAALIDSMRSKIGEALETEKVDITDVYGDGRHVSIDVVSEVFEGKSSMQRQRMVYKAIWMELQETVHAVDNMTTKTPAETSA